MPSDPTMKRIQRKRTKGWTMPEGAVYVGRPSRWGNPWTVGHADPWTGEPMDAAGAVAAFRYGIDTPSGRQAVVRDLGEASSLACWCPLDAPSHADVLIDILPGE